MNDLSKLREASDHVLYSLTADESIKYRILQKAADAEKKDMHHHVFRPLPAFCMVIAFLLIGAAALNSLQPVSPASSVEMNVFAAGDRETVSPGEGFSSELKGIDPENITSIELAGIGMIDDPRQCAVLVSLLNDEAVRVEKTVADDIYSLTFRTADNKICFNAEDPFLFGEENWSCPVFFSYFRKMMNE